MIIRVAKGENLETPLALKISNNDAIKANKKYNKLDDEIVSESSEPVYGTLKDRFNAENQIRENEGKGVRLAISSNSEDEHGQKRNKGKQVQIMSNCSDYGLKKSVNESQGKIIYPTPEDMANKQDFIFF